MFKKLLVATAILAASSSVALALYAPAPYMGASVGLVNNTSTNSTSISYRGITGNVNLGYGGIVSPNFYLAGELYVIPGAINVTGNNALKTTWGVAANILPGIMLNDRTIGYARLGAIESRFSSPGTWRIGGQAGLGIQTNVCQNWDVRGEYVYSKYATVRGVSAPNSDVYNVGVVYRFE